MRPKRVRMSRLHGLGALAGMVACVGIGTLDGRAAGESGPPSQPLPTAVDAARPLLCGVGDDPRIAEVEAAILDRRAPAPRRQRDFSCHASPAERKRLLADARTLVVDVRSEAAFESFRIPGSIHVRMGALRTKSQWRDRPLLLVNEGWSLMDLEETCRQLRQAGFSQVSLLAGGLRTWRDEVGPLEGALAPQADLSRIPPRVFTRERAYDTWLVVDVSAPGEESEVAEWLPEAVRVPFDEDSPDSVRFVDAVLDVLRERRRARPETTLLFVDSDPRRYAQIEQALGARAPPWALYLDGGLPAYRAYQTERAAVLARLARPTERRSCSAR